MYMHVCFFTKIRDTAIYPTKATRLSSFWDLYSSSDITLLSHQTTLVPTGLVAFMPEDCELQIRARSGLSTKNIILANGIGTIDADFCVKNKSDDPFKYEIKILLHNLNDTPFSIKQGDRVAQGFFNKLSEYTNLVYQLEFWSDYFSNETFEAQPCEVKDNIRLGGFGSTGK